MPTSIAAPEHPPEATPAPGSPGPEQRRNLEIMAAHNAAFNARDLDAMETFVADEFVNHGRIAGKAVWRMIQRDITARFPDARLDVKERVAIGDHVIARCVYSGTHLGVGFAPVDGGQMVGVAPTGNRFAVQHIHWWTLRDGKIVEHRACRDDVSMLMQLGLLPRVDRVAAPAGLDDGLVDHAQLTGGAEQARNIEVVRRNLHALADLDLDAALATYAEDCLNHGQPVGRAGLGLVLSDIFRTYTLLDQGDSGIREIVAVDDCVVTRLERRLRHTGVSQIPVAGAILMGREPTGRDFIQRQIHWWTLKDGLIVHHRACRDDVGMGMQLGLLPAPPPFPAAPPAS